MPLTAETEVSVSANRRCNAVFVVNIFLFDDVGLGFFEFALYLISFFISLLLF